MSYFRAYLKSNLQIRSELLSSVKKDCGGCLPSALTFEESVQRFPEMRHKKNFVVSLLTCNHVESFHQEVLIDVWVLNSLKGLKESGQIGSSVDNIGFEEEPPPLTIYLTRKLRDREQFVLNKDKCILLREVTAIPIKKATIGALSVESFEWAREHLKEFLIDSVNNHLVLVKQSGNLGEMIVQSDLHEMLSMLIVLECVPVMQGLVTAATMVVVSDIHRDDLGKWQMKQLKLMRGSGKTPHLPLLKMPGTKPALLRYTAIDLDEPDGGICHSKGDVLDKLQVSLLDFPFHCKSLPVIDQEADVDNQVWITKATMKEMQLNIGSWVRVFITLQKQGLPHFEDCIFQGGSSGIVPSNNNTQQPMSSKIKLAQVFPIEECRTAECTWQQHNTVTAPDNYEEFRSGTAYISPTLFFNLLHSPLDDIDSVMLYVERAELRESPPCFAKEITISVITSPLTKITNMYDVILAQHFTTPRLVSTGDVLCVYCDWKKLDAPNTQAVLDEGLPRSHVLYFKVNKLVGEDENSLSYFVDARHSKLYQVGNAKYVCLNLTLRFIPIV